MHAKAKRVQETADPMTANHGVSKGLGCCGIYTYGMSHFAPTLASIVDACVTTRTLANRSNAPMTPEGMVLGESKQLKSLHPLPLLGSLKVQWLEDEQTI